MDSEFENIVDRYMAIFQRVHQVMQNVDATIAILQEVAKDLRMARIEAKKRTLTKHATPKQLALLQELKVEYAPEISTKEASQLIDHAIKKQKG